MEVSLFNTRPLLLSNLTQICWDYATIVVYISPQEDTRYLTVEREADLNCALLEFLISSLSAIHILDIDNWQTHFLRGRDLCQRWGTPVMDSLSSRFHNNLSKLVFTYKEPVAVDSLLNLWDHLNPIYNFPL